MSNSKYRTTNCDEVTWNNGVTDHTFWYNNSNSQQKTMTKPYKENEPD